jgi:hypothetical protein
MKKTTAGKEKYRPLYSLDKKKNNTRTANSGTTISRGIILVESKADLMSAVPVNAELAFKYAGTAFARKGETRIKPPNVGNNQ